MPYLQNHEVIYFNIIFASPFCQLKELGHPGVNGVHALLRVIQDQDLEQEVSQVANLVLEAQSTLEIVTVSDPQLVIYSL